MNAQDQTTPNPDENPIADLPQLADFERAARAAAKGGTIVAFDELNQRLKTKNPTDADRPPEARADLGIPPAQAAREQPANDDLNDRLEELADDQLELLRRVQGLAASQSFLAKRIDELAHLVSQGHASLAQQLGQLRGDLASERRGLALKAVFDNLIGPYERLRAMAEALSAPVPKADKKSKAPADQKQQAERNLEAARNQIQSAVVILTRAIRDLGFEEYLPQLGEPFDPERMSCAGYAKGDPGIVLEVVKAGYGVGGLVTRPAEVLIADPMLTPQNPHP